MHKLLLRRRSAHAFTFTMILTALLIHPLIGLFFAGQVSADSHIDPDFNDDGIVNHADYDLFVPHWGTREGDDNWDAKFDLDGNGNIGLSDFVIFIDYFGKSVPVAVGTSAPVTVAPPVIRTVEENTAGGGRISANLSRLPV